MGTLPTSNNDKHWKEGAESKKKILLNNNNNIKTARIVMIQVIKSASIKINFCILIEKWRKAYASWKLNDEMPLNESKWIFILLMNEPKMYKKKSVATKKVERKATSDVKRRRNEVRKDNMSNNNNSKKIV